MEPDIDQEESLTLHLELLKHKYANVQELLGHGWDVNKQSSSGVTPLLLAVKMNELPIVALLLSSGADPNICDSRGFSPFLAGVLTGNNELLSLLIQKGASMEANQRAAVFYSVELRCASTLALLLREGACPNATLSSGVSVLMKACKRGRLDLVKVLLEGGADVEMKETIPRSYNALGISSTAEISELLLSYGADVNSSNLNGMTALMIAAAKDHVDTGRVLILNGADLEQTDMFGSTALVYSVIYGSLHFAELLLDHGADVNARGTACPLLFAYESGNEAMAEYLLLRGANSVPTDRRKSRTAATVASQLQALIKSNGELILGLGQNNPHQERGPLPSALRKKEIGMGEIGESRFGGRIPKSQRGSWNRLEEDGADGGRWCSASSQSRQTILSPATWEEIQGFLKDYEHIK